MWNGNFLMHEDQNFIQTRSYWEVIEKHLHQQSKILVMAIDHVTTAASWLEVTWVQTPVHVIYLKFWTSHMLL